MNPAHNRFARRRILIVFLIGLVVSFLLGMLEAGLRELFVGPIAGAGTGIVVWALLFLWQGGYPKAE